MKIADIAAALDDIAPNRYAQPWDNTGLLVGDPAANAGKVLFCIDLTQAVLDEAVKAKADLVMAYHPPLFKAIKTIRADRQSVLYSALSASIAIYSTHTAWDVVPGGANDLLADALGMSPKRRPLEDCQDPQACKLTVFLPESDLDAVRSAAFAAGAGKYGPDGNYSECGFHSEGTGTFHGSSVSNPAVGRRGSRQNVPELRWETICPLAKIADIVHAVRLAHSYEQPAIDIVSLCDRPDGFGLGRIGQLQNPVTLNGMISRIKKACGISSVLTANGKRSQAAKLKTLAIGCGSCGDMFHAAARGGADIFVTGEMRHHDALAARAAGLTVVCTNHSNSERLTLKPMSDMLKQRIKGVKTIISKVDADPFVIM